MVSDVYCIVSIETVAAAENFVLVSAEVGILEPDCAVLFISETAVFKELNGFCNITALMEVALEEPLVELNAIALNTCRRLFRKSLRQEP